MDKVVLVTGASLRVVELGNFVIGIVQHDTLLLLPLLLLLLLIRLDLLHFLLLFLLLLKFSFFFDIWSFNQQYSLPIKIIIFRLSVLFLILDSEIEES